MNGIGWAVKQMQNGSKVMRAGWNGKDMWIGLVPSDQWDWGAPLRLTTARQDRESCALGSVSRLRTACLYRGTPLRVTCSQPIGKSWSKSMVKVARKHVIAAVETLGKLLHFPKYAVKAKPYVGQDKRIGEFGWTIAVLPAG